MNYIIDYIVISAGTRHQEVVEKEAALKLVKCKNIKVLSFINKNNLQTQNIVDFINKN